MLTVRLVEGLPFERVAPLNFIFQTQVRSMGTPIDLTFISINHGINQNLEANPRKTGHSACR
jgi:hypothetical protein